MKKYYGVKYNGKFGFLKPVSAVKDSKTTSSFFLPKSVLMGMEKLIFPELLHEKSLMKIKRFKLIHKGISWQQEVTNSVDTSLKKHKGKLVYGKSIINRGVMINPELYLFFDNKEDAEKAYETHLFLCRNEDIILPFDKIVEVDENEIDEMNGFEVLNTDNEDDVYFGYNRYTQKPQYGIMCIDGEKIM